MSHDEVGGSSENTAESGTSEDTTDNTDLIPRDEGDVVSDSTDEGEPSPSMGQLIRALSQVAAIEKQRLEAQEKRGAIVLRTLETADKIDQRQSDFHSNRLASERRARDQAHSM